MAEESFKDSTQMLKYSMRGLFDEPAPANPNFNNDSATPTITIRKSRRQETAREPANPRSPIFDTLGWDDAVDPLLVGGKQVWDYMKARGNSAIKNPVPINWSRLGAGTVAGVLTESATQQGFNALRDGDTSRNPYVANLERLGSRMVGGATSGVVMGGGPIGAAYGMTTAAGVDAAENLYGIGKGLVELYGLRREAIASGDVKPSKSMLKP